MALGSLALNARGTASLQQGYSHPHIDRVFKGLQASSQSSTQVQKPLDPATAKLAARQRILFDGLRKIIRTPKYWFASALDSLLYYVGYGNSERFKIKDVVLSPKIVNIANVKVIDGAQFSHKYDGFPDGKKSVGLSIAIFEPKDQTKFKKNPRTEIIVPGGGFNATGYLPKIAMAIEEGKRVAFITPGKEHNDVSGRRELSVSTIVTDISAALYHLINQYKDTSDLELFLGSLGTLFGPQALLDIKDKFKDLKFHSIKLATPLRSIKHLIDDLKNPKEHYVFKEMLGPVSTRVLGRFGGIIEKAFEGEERDIANSKNLSGLLEMVKADKDPSTGLFLFGARKDGFVPSYDYAKDLVDNLSKEINEKDPDRVQYPNLWFYNMDAGHFDYVDTERHREDKNIIVDNRYRGQNGVRPHGL